MAALTAARDTKQKGQESVTDFLDVPVKASTTLQAGGIVVSDAGYAAPGRAALGLLPLGVARKKYDNSTGAAGAITADVRRGTFKFGNSAAGDAIAQANVGALCYIVDDQTVALTDGNGARSVAGKICAVDSDGVWVEFLAIQSPADALVRTVVTLPIDLPSVATGVVAQFIPKFDGRILRADFMGVKPVTTGAKAATLTPRIATVAVTGGVMALTSANCTPVGTLVAGTAITGANTFVAGQTVDINASAVTTFVEGTGAVLLGLA